MRLLFFFLFIYFFTEFLFFALPLQTDKAFRLTLADLGSQMLGFDVNIGPVWRQLLLSVYAQLRPSQRTNLIRPCL